MKLFVAGSSKYVTDDFLGVFTTRESAAVALREYFQKQIFESERYPSNIQHWTQLRDHPDECIWEIDADTLDPE